MHAWDKMLSGLVLWYPISFRQIVYLIGIKKIQTNTRGIRHCLRTLDKYLPEVVALLILCNTCTRT